MKKFTYPLSDNDIQTLMDALAVMVNVIPDSDLFPPETIDLALFYRNIFIPQYQYIQKHAANALYGTYSC